MTRITFKNAAHALYVAAADARAAAQQLHLLARDAYAADDVLLAAEHEAQAAELDAIVARLTAAAMAADMADGCDDAEQVEGLIVKIKRHIFGAAVAAASQSGTGIESLRWTILTAYDLVSRLSAGASASVTTEA